ncbi:MAG TPA: glycerate-2-kinase family protein, partial [bacterium]|nr:glycerate-2-kinase family protein [bacterium]
MRYVRNHRQLIDNACNLPDRHGRDMALELYETALQAVQPESLFAAQVRVDASRLLIGEAAFDMLQYEHIWVIGVGKAAGDMAKALEDRLGTRITGGCVVCNREVYLDRIECIVGGHPLPNAASIEAGEKIMTIARLAGEHDLVITLVSGGGSALAEVPLEGVSLAQLVEITTLLLHSGATVEQMNYIRKCLSRFKAGGVLRQIKATCIIGLYISDV